MPLDITLPTTEGDTRSISRFRGQSLVFIVAEARSHLPMNDAFKRHIKRFTDENLAIARQIELVPIAQLQKEPLFARSIVDAFVWAEAKRTGAIIWLDWKGEAMTAIGQKRDADTPAYILLDRAGEVRWGRFGKLDASHEQALLTAIESLTA
jgi:hypothetical protein